MYQPRSDSTGDSGPDVDMFCQLACIPRERARLAVPNTGAVEAYWISGRLVLVAVIALCVGPAKNRRNIGRVFCTFSSLIFVARGSGFYCGQIVMLHQLCFRAVPHQKGLVHTNSGTASPFLFCMVIEHLILQEFAQSSSPPWELLSVFLPRECLFTS